MHIRHQQHRALETVNCWSRQPSREGFIRTKLVRQEFEKHRLVVNTTRGTLVL